VEIPCFEQKSLDHCDPGHIQENASAKAQKVFFTTLLSFPQAGRVEERAHYRQWERKLALAWLGLYRCCLCNSPGYNSGRRQQRQQPQNSFM